MALIFIDRAQQQGTANTTVSFTLTTLVTGFQSLAGIGNGNTTYYAATDTVGNWETGLGTYTTAGTLLTRTTVLESSNANAAVTFTSTVNVFITYAASKSAHLDANGKLSAAASLIVNVPAGDILSTNIQAAINELGLRNDKTFNYAQGTASATWIIPHNMGKNPSVIVIDSAGDQVDGQITYTNTNSLQIVFSGAFSGNAFLN